MTIQFEFYTQNEFSNNNKNILNEETRNQKPESEEEGDADHTHTIYEQFISFLSHHTHTHQVFTPSELQPNPTNQSISHSHSSEVLSKFLVRHNLKIPQIH